MRNVLLMLSGAQPPPPREEIASLALRSKGGNTVALVTTRDVTGLTAGESVVALYGDTTLDNAFLGCGVFERVVSIDSPVGQAVSRQDELYGAEGIPAGAKALILLNTVREAADEEGLAVLDGTIEASGLPLTLANIPRSPARIQVYYTTSTGRMGIAPTRSG